MRLQGQAVGLTGKKKQSARPDLCRYADNFSRHNMFLAAWLVQTRALARQRAGTGPHLPNGCGCQNPMVPLVNIKIDGKWMFIHPKMARHR